MTIEEEMKKLSDLTEEAIENKDLESLKLIKKIVDKDREDAPINFGEFFYSMTPPEMLQEISKS